MILVSTLPANGSAGGTFWSCCPIATCQSVTGALEAWPALKQWDAEYLAHKAGTAKVTVDCTPHGRGDAVTKIHHTQELDGGSSAPQGCLSQGHKYFVTPCEMQMEVRQFFELLRASRQFSGIVPYVQVSGRSLQA